MLIVSLLCCIGFVAAYLDHHPTASASLLHPRTRPSRIRALAFDDMMLANAAVSEDTLHFLQVSTPVASQVLFLSPLAVMGNFRSEGTKDASALPYAAMVTNGAAWCAYGVLAPGSPDLTIMAANIGGVFFGLYYCATFYQHMSKGSDGPVLFAGAFAILAAIIATCILLPAEMAHELTGYSAVGFCILMFSGPLASVQAILRNCCASSLPIGFTVATVVNCLLWCAYGMLSIHDPLVWAPNVAGLVASVTQLGLYSKYGDNEEGCDLYEEGCWLPV